MNNLKKIIESNIFFLLALIAIIFLLYGKSINYELLFLDDLYTLETNVDFVSNIKNLPNLFVRNCYYDETKKEGYYRPVLTLTFFIETVIFGYNPKIYHLTSIILFILSIYLMYVFLSKLNLNKNITKLTLLLVSVSPLFTSNAVYVSPRAETLLTVFTILSLLLIYNYYNTNKFISLFLSNLFFLLSLWTKESAIVLIFIVPIFLYSINNSITKHKNFIKLYFGFVLTIAVYFIFRSYAVINSSLTLYLQNLTFILRNTINGFVIYIDKLLIPNDIPIVLYNYVPDISSIINTLLFIIFLIIICYKNFINRKFLLLGLAIFTLYLLPSFFIIQSQLFFHRLLLPSLGIILIFILLIQKFIKLFPVSKKYIISVFIILFFVFSYGSYIQANKYKDNTTFIINGYEVAPDYPVFYINFHANKARELYSQGNYKQALDIYMDLLEKDKNEPYSYYYSIGLLCYKLGDTDNAIKYVNKAVDFDKTNIKYKKLAEEILFNKKEQ